jgi:hypothetical protein
MVKKTPATFAFVTDAKTVSDEIPNRVMKEVFGALGHHGYSTISELKGRCAVILYTRTADEVGFPPLPQESNGTVENLFYGSSGMPQSWLCAIVPYPGSVELLREGLPHLKINLNNCGMASFEKAPKARKTASMGM